MAQIILDSNNNLIQGDFDNATLNNRTKLQTTTTNATTNVYVVPNGSSTSAGVSVANNSSLTNASKIVMATNGSTDTQIISGVNGSGSYLPMSFYTNNTLAMQITTAGNIVVASTAAPAFSVSQVTSQNVSTNTQTKVAFDSEEFDTASCFDTSTNRFTPNVAGYYYLNANIRFNLGTVVGNGEYYISIYKNGTQFKRGFNRGVSGPGTGTNILLGISSLIYANGTTDYFEIYALQCSTTTATISVGDNPQQPFFQGFLARSA